MLIKVAEYRYHSMVRRLSVINISESFHWNDFSSITSFRIIFIFFPRLFAIESWIFHIRIHIIIIMIGQSRVLRIHIHCILLKVHRVIVIIYLHVLFLHHRIMIIIQHRIVIHRRFHLVQHLIIVIRH